MCKHNVIHKTGYIAYRDVARERPIHGQLVTRVKYLVKHGFVVHGIHNRKIYSQTNRQTDTCTVLIAILRIEHIARTAAIPCTLTSVECLIIYRVRLHLA